MKLHKFLAKYAFKLLLLLAVMLSPLFFLSLPAIAPTLENTLQERPANNSDSPGSIFDTEHISKIDDSEVLAKSYLVYEVESGDVIASRSPKIAVSIASLTKLMTAYLVLKYGNQQDLVTVKSADVLTVNPVLGLKAGDTVKVSDLVQSLLVGSANDAATSLGSYLESKQNMKVAEFMNAEAENLGMDDTHYNNPIGFDSDTNYSTAEDMKIMLQKLSEKIDFNTYNKLSGYSFIGINNQSYYVQATNKLIGTHSDIYAIKTGFTDDAQGAMIITLKSARTLNKPLNIIVLQSPQREQDTLLLREAILNTFFPINSNSSQVPAPIQAQVPSLDIPR